MAVATNSAEIVFPVTGAWNTDTIEYFVLWNHATQRTADRQVAVGQFASPLTPPLQVTQEVKFAIGGLRLLIPNGAFQGHVLDDALDDEITNKTLWVTLHTGTPGATGSSEVATTGGYAVQTVAAAEWDFDASINA